MIDARDPFGWCGMPGLFGILAGVVAFWAGSTLLSPAAEQGDAERGRAVFNGKGICHYCHGTDGDPDRRPRLNRDTAEVVARLAPNPPDLRNPLVLKLKFDKERFRIIRDGHTGTGMLPDTTLTDQEITDTLAYLAALRRQ